MKETISQRLSKALNARGMKAIDLANATNLSRGAISQYLSGKVIPKQDKLYLLAKALHVTEPWLMGYDVDSTTHHVKEIPQNAEPINELVNELFADRPDVLALLTNGVYDDEGIYAGKKLSDLSEPAKKHLKDTILSVLEMSGYLKSDIK